MSVTIRLAKIGKRNAPAYKIVATTTRSRRDGKNLDILGHYNPSHNPELFSIDKKKLKEWQDKGAITSDAVKKLVAGTYTFVKYEPNKKGEKVEEVTETTEVIEEESSEKKEEAPKAEEKEVSETVEKA